MMKKNLKIIFMLLKMKLSKMMVFRFDFFGAFFVDSSLFILQLLMFNSIQEGELDYYITKPLDPLFRLTFENINIGSSPLILASILIVLYGISELNSEITLVMIIIYIFMVLLMTLLFYDVCIILRTVSFFVISSSAIMRLEDNLLPMNMKIPGVIYSILIVFLFTLFMWRFWKLGMRHYKSASS